MYNTPSMHTVGVPISTTEEVWMRMKLNCAIFIQIEVAAILEPWSDAWSRIKVEKDFRCRHRTNSEAGRMRRGYGFRRSRRNAQ